MSPIPDDELISAYLDDELPREERLRAEQLLLDRADLRRLFEEMRGLRQGLRSLPKFSLGEEFSAGVLRKAERSVLQSNLPAAENGGEAAASKATEAAAGRDAAPAPASSVSATSKPATSSGPALPVDRSRLLRPIIYSLTAIAAALALVIYEQVNVLERREARHVAQAPLPNADGEKKAESDKKPGDAKEAGRKEDETARTTEAADKFKDEKAGLLRKNAAIVLDAAPRDADRDMARKPEATPAAERPTGAFAVGNTFGINAPRGNAANPDVPTPSPASVAAKGDAFAATGPLDAATVEGIAVQDFERFQSLIYNSRLPQTKRADGLIDAGRLQEFAASSQIAIPGTSQSNMAVENNFRDGSIAGKSNGIGSALNGNLARATDAYQMQQSLAASGAAQQPYGNVRADNNWSYAGAYGDNGNFVVVVCDVEPEAIEEFSQLLPRVQIADVSLTKNREAAQLVEKLQAGGADERATVKQEAAKSDVVAKKLNQINEARVAGAAGGVPSSNDMAGGGFGGGGGASRPVPGSRMSVVDETQTDAAALKRSGQIVPAGDGVQEAAEEQEYEYFRVVANRRQLESALKMIRAQPQLYRNVRVEPAAQEAAERAHWQAYNRGLPLADAKAEFAGRAAKPALAAGAMVAGTTENLIAPGGAPAAAPSVAAPSVVASPVSTPTAPAMVAPAAPAPATPAPVVAGPSVALPAAPPVAAAPPIPAATGAPGAPPMAKTQVAVQTRTDQPSAPQEIRSRSGEQAYESQQQQRRGYAFSRSQRISGRDIAEQNAGFYSVFNPAGEPTNAPHAAAPGAMPTEPGRQDLAASESKKSVADKLSQAAMKEGGASSPETGGSGEKTTGVERGVAAKSATPAKVAAPAAPGVTVVPSATAPPPKAAPVPVAAATSMPAAPKSAEAESKPKTALEVQLLAKDGADGGRAKSAETGDRKANLGARQDAPPPQSASQAAPQATAAASSGGLAGATAPTIVPTTPAAMLPMPAASPAQVLDDIAGAYRPLPLVQQPALQLPQTQRAIQDEQTSRQNGMQQLAELPDDYHEALFIFRVVKRGSTPAAHAGEADSSAKPAAATTPTGK